MLQWKWVGPKNGKSVERFLVHFVTPCYPPKHGWELSNLDRLGTSRVMQTQMDRVGVATGREKSAIAMRAFDGVPGLGDSLNLVAPCACNR